MQDFSDRSGAPAADGRRCYDKQRGEFQMSITTQSPTQGDFYAPGPTVVVPATQGQLRRTEQGDYYVGGNMILNKRRAEALKTCTHMKAFDSDAYVACMQREGQAP
jgi:hypothetical protein